MILKITLENVTADGRELEEIKLGDNTALIPTCHLLYVARSMNSRLEKITRIIDGRPILSVGEGREFVAQGGMVGFYEQNNKVRLSVCQNRIRAARLEPDANLLRLSEIPSGCKE